MTQPPPEHPYGQSPGDQPGYGQGHDQSGYGQGHDQSGSGQAYGQGYDQGHGQAYDQGGPPPSRPKGMAITALVLGVLALLLCWTILGGILLGLLAVILGLIAASRAKRGTAGGRGMAITGAVLGLVGAVLSGLLIALGLSFLNSESGQDLQDCLTRAGEDQAAVDQCRRDFEDELGQG